MACGHMEYCKHTQEVTVSDTDHDTIGEVSDLLPPPLTLHWCRQDTCANEFDTVARSLPDLKTIILCNAVITQPLKINASIKETVFIDCTISHDVFVSLIPQNGSFVVGGVHTRFSDMGYNCMSGKSTLWTMSVDIGSVNDPCTLSRAITFIEGVQDIELIGELDRDAGLMQQILNMFTTLLMEVKIKQKGNIIVCHRLPVCSKHFSVVPKLLWMSSVLYMNQLTFLERLHIECSDGELKSLMASISTITSHQLRTLHV